MVIRTEVEINEFWALYEMCWSGAKAVLDEIIKQDREEELMALLEDIFYEGATALEVNDFIWFDVESEDFLNLYPKEEEEEEEEN